MTNLLTAILFAVNAALWGYKAVAEESVFYGILAAVWLWGASTWFVRYLKQRNENEEK